MPNVTDSPIEAQAAVKAEHDDTRADPRRRMLKGGTICFNGRQSTITCAVRDVSTYGARLRVSSLVNVPDAFELLIEIDGVRVDCAVVWRSKGEIGVKFTSERTQAPPRRKQVINHQEVAASNPSLRRLPKLT